MEKLYIIVRDDLRPGLQVAQACHAQHAFATEHPESTAAWEGNLVVLRVPGEQGLAFLCATMASFGYNTSAFFEPDLGDALTAIAVGGEAAELLKGLPLALNHCAPALVA